MKKYKVILVGAGDRGKTYTDIMFDMNDKAEKPVVPTAEECGIRFLTDYLNGDTYFKIHREHHNLDRARNQFELVRDIEEKEEELNRIIKSMI